MLLRTWQNGSVIPHLEGNESSLSLNRNPIGLLGHWEGLCGRRFSRINARNGFFSGFFFRSSRSFN